MFSLSACLNTAQKLMEQNEFLEAAQYYEQALQFTPNDGHTRLKCAVAFKRAGQYQNAIKHYQHVVTLNPNTPNIFNLIGEMYRALQDYKQAKIYFDKQKDQNQIVRLALRQSDLNSMYQKGLAHFECKELEEAKKCFENVLEQDCNHFDTLFDLARLHSCQENYEATINYYDRALKQQPKNIAVLNNAGSIFYNKELYQAALECFDLALENMGVDDERYLAVLMNKARTLKKLEKESEGVSILYQLAQHFEQQNNSALALNCYNQLHTLFPLHRDSWMAKIKLFYNSKNVAKAKECLEIMLNQNPSDRFALNNLAYLYRTEKEFDKAMSLHKKIHQAKLQNEKTEFEYGLLLVAQKKYDKAIRCFSHMRHEYPEHLVVLEEMASIFVVQKQAQEAFNCYEEIHKLSKDPVMRARAYCQQGKLYKRPEATAEAKCCFEQAIQFNPNYGEAYYALGMVHFENDKMPQAYEYIFKAVEYGYRNIDASIFSQIMVSSVNAITAAKTQQSKPATTSTANTSNNNNNASNQNIIPQSNQKSQRAKKTLVIQQIPTESLATILYDQPALPKVEAPQSSSDKNENNQSVNLELRKSL